MLARRHLLERRGLHALEPDRAAERAGEDEREDTQEKPDAAVGAPLVHRCERRQLHVEGQLRVGAHEPELRAGLGLDPGVRRGARELGAEPVRVGAQLDALAAELVEPDVQLEHGDVDGDDAGQQDGEHHDPDDAAERTHLRADGGASGRPLARPRDTRCLDAFGSRPAGHQSVPDLHRGAELCGRGARVGLELALSRPQRLARQVAQDRLVAADADRELRRARAAASQLAEVPLDDPVLERVEADDGDAATGPKHSHRRRESGFERAELVVDRDPK